MGSSSILWKPLVVLTLTIHVLEEGETPWTKVILQLHPPPIVTYLINSRSPNHIYIYKHVRT